MGVVADIRNHKWLLLKPLPPAVEIHITGSVYNAVKDSFVMNAQNIKRT